MEMDQLVRRRRRVFACFMGGFLIAQFIPVEFTSILTATVWSFSGRMYALGFLIAGTFLRVDSLSIFSGLEALLVRISPGIAGVGPQYVAASVMLFGNLAVAVLFKALLRRTVLSRVPAAMFAA